MTIHRREQNEGFYYSANEAGTGIIITGYEYNATATNVVVPNTIDGLPVVEIGDGVFEGNTVMTSISLPATVEVIGVRAFANCTALTTMDSTAQ